MALPTDTRSFHQEPPSGFQQLVGYRVAEWTEDYAVLELALEPKHGNRAGALHGGVLTTLIDTACGFAATWCPFPGRVRRIITLSLTSTFVAGAGPGTIRAIGRKKGGGSRIVFCSAEVLDDDGRLIALGEGTFRYRSGSQSPEGIPLTPEPLD